jgi:hypothetical protein
LTCRGDPSRFSRLERLPPELKLAIASKIPNAQSAINLALLGPEFYDSVTGFEGEPAAKSFFMTLGPDLMPLAAMCYRVKALKLKPLEACKDPNGRDYDHDLSLS